MKLMFHLSRLRNGFTLIELIVVIAILGILAIALITALNPIEHVNRATDTTTLSTAREFISSANQFQTAKLYSSACPDADCSSFQDSLASGTPVALSTLSAVNASMDAAGASDSPTNFVTFGQAAEMYVTLSGTAVPREAQYVICWQPLSRLLKSEADVNDPTTTVFNSAGSIQTASACPASNSNTCFRCLRQ